VIENPVFLVLELTVRRAGFSRLKEYKKQINETLSPFNPEYVLNVHAYEWVDVTENESLPTGLQIIRFENEGLAQRAIEALNKVKDEKLERELFTKKRCYLSRHDFPDELRREIFSD